MWNGTAEILNARPTRMNTTPTIRPGEAVSGRISVFASAAKSMVPEKP